MLRPLNYTTKVPVDKTVAEVHAIIASAGASAIGTTYEGGKIAGVNFVLGGHPYVLPVDVPAMLRYLLQAAQAGELNYNNLAKSKMLTIEHAGKVAWRVVKDWLEAQLALIEAGQARADQIFLPYTVDEQGITLYTRWRETQGLPALEAGSG